MRAFHSHGLQAWKPALLAGIVAGLITVAVVVSPWLSFAYANPELHIVLETAEALIGIFVVYLLVGRLLQRRLRSDQWLVFALIVLAGTNIAGAVQGAVLSQAALSAAAWGQVFARLLGAWAVATAAFASPTPIEEPRRATRRAALAGLAVIAVALVVGGWAGPHLPSLLVEAVSSDAAVRPLLVGHSFLLGAQIASSGLFMVAAARFGARAARNDDELMRWIAAAMVLSAFARLNYLLFPSLYSGYVYTGDVLRLASYLLLAVGATREIRGYWRTQAQAAAAEERRRLARDLHDGLAQELNFLTMQARRLVNRPQLESARVELDRISSAGQRALEEARRAIDFLTLEQDEPLADLLARTVEDVAVRHGATSAVDIAPDEAIEGDHAEQMMRIVREAVTNACTHGHAKHVAVQVARSPRELLVTVRDNGQGFDAAAPRGRSSFGLTSMRERAAGLGGAFDIATHPGDGTTVTVRIPTAGRGASLESGSRLTLGGRTRG